MSLQEIKKKLWEISDDFFFKFWRTHSKNIKQIFTVLRKVLNHS